MTQPSKSKRRFTLAVLALAGVGLTLAVTFAAPPVLLGTVKNFVVPEYFDPPHQTQLKTLVYGAVAEPDGPGRIRIKKLRIETFRENGEPELSVEAPECLYLLEAREATSTSELTAQSGDGQLRLTGTGFLFRQTNLSLTISNNVRTVIRNLGQTAFKKP